MTPPRSGSPPAATTSLAIAADPGIFARAWLTGRLKVEGNLFDLLRLRKLMS